MSASIDFASSGFRAVIRRVQPRIPLIVVGLGLLLIAAGFFVAGQVIEHERLQAVAGVEKETAILARAYEEHVHQVVRRLDTALTDLRDDYERDPAAFAGKAAWHSPMHGDLGFHVLVVGADGLPVASSLEVPAHPLDFSDREYFRFHRDSAEDRLYIGKPLVGRISGQQTVQVTRRLRRPDGAFGGVMVLSVDPERLAGFYGPAEIGTTGTVMLVGTDRVIRARSSSFRPALPAPAQAVGSTHPDRPFFDSAQPSSGVFHASSPIDGVPRVVAYRRLSVDPLVVIVSLGEAEAMAGFEERRQSIVRAEIIVSAIVLCGVLAVAWLTHLQARQQHRLRAAKALLAQTEERWRLALGAVGYGVWDWNPQSGEVYYSARWKAMLGFAEDEIGDGISERDSRIHPDDRDAVHAALERHFSGQTPFYADEHRVRCKDGRYTWILDRGVVVSRGADGRPTRVVGTHTDITERKRTEGALNATAARLTAILDSVPVGIVIVDSDRRITVANAKMAQMLQRTVDELVGAPAQILHGSGELDENIGQRLYPMVNFGGTVSEELPMRRSDGTSFWARMAGRRIAMDDPSLGTVWAVDDVSQRKKAELALDASYRFQRTLIDTIPIPIFVKDAAFRYIDANAAFERWIGKERDALRGLPVSAIAPPELARVYEEADRTLLASPHTQVYEALTKGADGIEREVEFSKAVFHDAAGVPAGIVGIMIDVSGRKQAELALRKRQELFEQIFVANLAVKLLVDPADGRIVDANPAAAAFYGRGLDELTTMRIADIDTLSAGEVRQETERAAAEGRRCCLFRHRVAGGEIRDVEVYSSLIEVNGRSLLLFLVHDVTERRKAEEALERQTAELQRSNAELEAFAYVASHDLRQPLRTINSYLALVEKDLEGQLDDDTREYIAFARSGAQRMDRLIIDLLEYSRVGRKSKPFEDCPASEIVETAIQNLEVAIAEASATVTVDDGLPTLWGDANELVRLFQNIVGNAVKYRDAARDPVIHVSCEGGSAEGGADVWHFTVRDNGIGIGAEDFERVFGIFQRLHGRDEYEGTGVGLAVCKKIVEHHGGRIWVESRLGEGSVFHITLSSRKAPHA
ncbi:PAS domain S-box protein [Azospirillum sp. sgz301742]